MEREENNDWEIEAEAEHQAELTAADSDREEKKLEILTELFLPF